MTDQILEYLGNAHASHIHARGRRSTNKMIELLEVQENEKVLEIGFGTGATIVQMAARYKAHFSGYETSTLMYQKASKRIQFCKMLERISLALLEKKNCFPASDNTFDRVYIESIIAIQEGDDFRNLLLEIKRVLKPNGVLLFNETIWIDSTNRLKAKHINEACKKSFGIIQATDEYLHLADWKNLLTEIGFKHEFEIRVNEIPPIKTRMSMPVFYSEVFTLFGKVKSLASPSMRRTWKNFQSKMESITTKHEKVMEGIIIKVSNQK